MKILAIIINIFLPGIGTLIIGRFVAGIIQILLYGCGLILTLIGLFAVFGIPLCIIVWIWAIVTTALYTPPEPPQTSSE